MKIIYRVDAAGRKNYYKINNSGTESRISKNELTDNQIDNASLSRYHSDPIKTSRKSKSPTKKSPTRSKSPKRRNSPSKSRQILDDIVDKVETKAENKILQDDNLSKEEVKDIIENEVNKEVNKKLKTKNIKELKELIKETEISDNVKIAKMTKDTLIVLVQAYILFKVAPLMAVWWAYNY